MELREAIQADGERILRTVPGLNTAVDVWAPFASLALNGDTTISMIHRDGTIIARYPHVDQFIGIDLSPRMIERARATGLYAELVVAEMVRSR